MARYIDADKLYQETEKKIKAENSQGLAVMDDEFLDLIDQAPTADVVPKSEVEYMTKEEIVQIIGEADKYCKNTSCAKCKFNEIKTPYCWWYNIAEHIYTAQNTKNFDSRQTAEENKKKYTESEGERYKYAERNRCNE